MAASAAGALAMEWLVEIEEIRSKSTSMQGRLSGHLKENVSKLKEMVCTLVGKAEAVGDPLYLRMRNSELSQQLTELRAMCERNKRELEEANKRIKELQSKDGFLGSKRKIETEERKEKDKRRNETGKERDDGMMEVEMISESNREGDTVWRPPLRGVSTSVPASKRSSQALENKTVREKALSLQISELVKLRSEIRRDNKEMEGKGKGGKPKEDDPRQSGNSEAPKRQRGPRIIANVQLTPPDNREFLPLPSISIKQGRVEVNEEETRNETDNWTPAGKKKGRKDREPNGQTRDREKRYEASDLPDNRKAAREGGEGGKTSPRAAPRQGSEDDSCHDHWS